jgi:uncharacterized protein involved in exopolysaccharide biosynthesis/Mrp family chromosome partitioning ATPase
MGQLTMTGYAGGAPGPQDGTASVGDLWRILWRRRKLIVMTAIVLFTATLGYGMVASPLYTATSEILIDPRDREVVLHDVNPTGVAPDGGVTQVESQARVLESSAVLLRAIAATHLTADPEFNAPGIKDKIGALFGRLPVEQTALQAQAQTLRTLKSHLAIKRADREFVIEVMVTANNPDKAALLANAVADAYLADQAAAKEAAGQSASNELTARLEEQRKRVQAAEDAIQHYKEAHNIVVSSGQLVGEQQLTDVNNQLAAAQTKTALLRAQIEQIDRARRGGAAPDATAEVMQSGVIAKLREQEASLVQQQAEIQSRLGPRHPAYLAINAQLSHVRQLIGAELSRIASSAQADYDRAIANQKLLQVNVDKLKTSALAMGQTAVRLRELERNLDADKSVYAAFLVRAQETREQAGIDTTNARVITRAFPPSEKSWPKMSLLLAGALGSGLGLGAAFALIREYASPSILSRGQIERATGAAVIGILPGSVLEKRRRRGRTSTGHDDATPHALAVTGLALRRLFETDALPRQAGRARSVVVTSGPSDGEARRRVCHLFAAAASMRGERVLLVDGDFVETGAAGAGLQEILLGESTLGAFIDIPTPAGVTRLDGGRIRSAFPEAAGRDRAGEMLVEAGGHFELVVVDGGPVAENLCIAPLAAVADEILLVARLAVSSQAEVTAAADAAAIMGRPVSAVLLVDTMATG